MEHELVARLQVRHPNVPIVFCDNRKFAEEWTYRFLGAALAELGVLDQALDRGVPVWVGGANAAYLAEALDRKRIRAVTDPAALPRLARRRT